MIRTVWEGKEPKHEQLRNRLGTKVFHARKRFVPLLSELVKIVALGKTNAISTLVQVRKDNFDIVMFIHYYLV